MGLPRSKADPAEVQLASLANHVITTTVFLYCSMAFGTLLHTRNTHMSRMEDGTLQKGLTLVLAAIQLDVSLSSSHFLIQRFNQRQRAGSCQFSPHAKLEREKNTGAWTSNQKSRLLCTHQKTCEHLHCTGLQS